MPLYLSDPAHFDPAEIQTTQPAPHQPDPRISEDCLQLDVVVPKTVWDERNSSSDAPVLVWIHGGGYVAGSKDAAGRPVGLIKNSARDSSQKPLIFVALNYRLGAFGFSSGTKFIDQGGVPNAGLLDQRLALNWVQQNIHLFGGNKDKVTVMGESAGGGSIEFHITVSWRHVAWLTRENANA